MQVFPVLNMLNLNLRRKGISQHITCLMMAEGKMILLLLLLLIIHCWRNFEHVIEMNCFGLQSYSVNCVFLFSDRIVTSRGQAQDLLSKWPVAIVTIASSTLLESSLSVFYEAKRTRLTRTLAPPLSSLHRCCPLRSLHPHPSLLLARHHPVLLKAGHHQHSTTHPGQLWSSKLSEILSMSAGCCVNWTE